MQDKIKQKIEDKVGQVIAESGHGEVIIRIVESEIKFVDKFVKEKTEDIPFPGA